MNARFIAGLDSWDPRVSEYHGLMLRSELALICACISLTFEVLISIMHSFKTKLDCNLSDQLEWDFLGFFHWNLILLHIFAVAALTHICLVFGYYPYQLGESFICTQFVNRSKGTQLYNYVFKTLCIYVSIYFSLSLCVLFDLNFYWLYYILP